MTNEYPPRAGSKTARAAEALRAQGPMSAAALSDAIELEDTKQLLSILGTALLHDYIVVDRSRKPFMFCIGPGKQTDAKAAASPPPAPPVPPPAPLNAPPPAKKSVRPAEAATTAQASRERLRIGLFSDECLLLEFPDGTTVALDPPATRALIDFLDQHALFSH